MDSAMKFDDIVLEFSRPNDNMMRFIQVDWADTRFITSKELMTMNDCFSLPKYFHSFVTIRNTPAFQNKEIQDFIILTNLGFKNEIADNFLQKQSDGTMKYLREVIDWSDDLLNFEGGNIYKFVARDDPIRADLLNILREKFQESLDLKKLANEFVQIMVGRKKTTDLLKMYAVSLVKYVVDVKSKKINANFLNRNWNNTTPENVKIFRDHIEEAYKALCCPNKPSWDTSSKSLLEDIALFENVISIESNPQLPDPIRIAEQLACLINDTITGQVIHINNQLGKDINILAGHFFVKGEDNIVMRLGFSNNDQLPGNLNDFKNELKKRLGPIFFDRLGECNFNIVNFKTCKEIDFANALNPIFPIGEITDDDINDFLDQLVFVTNQPNVDQLVPLIKNEIAKICDGVDIDLDINLISSAFEVEMMNWLSARLGRYKTDKDIDWSLKKLQIKFYRIEMQKLTTNYESTNNNKRIEFLTENEEWFLKLNQFYDSSSKHVFLFLTPAKQNWLGTLRVFQFLNLEKSEKKDFYYIFNKLSNLVLAKDKIIDIMSSVEGRFLLVIECDKDIIVKQYSFLEKIKELLKKQRIKLILVGQTSNYLIDYFKTNESLNLTASFKDLSVLSQNSLLMNQINFQGKEILLKELVPMDKPEILETIDLDKFFKGEILKMGQSDLVSADYKNLTDDCYIERNLYSKNQLDLKKFIIYFENIFEELKSLIYKEFENKNMNFVIDEEKNSFEIAMSNWFKAHVYTLKTSEHLKLFLYTQLIEFACKIKENSKKTSSQIGKQTLGILGSSENSKIELIVNNYFVANHFADKIVINTNVEVNYIEFCKNYENANVHWLVESASGIHWKKTHGSSNFIREYLIESQVIIPENALMDEHVGRIVIISDVPGMGKSTLLSSLITKIQQNSAQKWQIRINLNDFTNVFNTKKPVVDAFDYLSKDILNIDDPFELALLSHYCQTLDKSIIFLDGFDEICPTYESIVLDLITKLFTTVKSRIVVTTRPERRIILENKLNQIAHSLVIFDKKNQINFLLHSWMKTMKIQNDDNIFHFISIFKLKTFAEIFSDVFEKSISESDTSFIGVPIKSCMLSEIYEDDAKASLNSQNDNLTFQILHIRLSDIYEKCISKKTSNFFSEKYKSDETNDTQKQLKSVLEKEILIWHQLLALKQLLTEKELNIMSNIKTIQLNENLVLRFGLVLKHNNNFKFIHRTYAEYFAFLFFTNNLKDDRVAKFIVQTIICNKDQNTISREFFNNYFEENIIEINILELYGQCFLDPENGSALRIATNETRSNLFEFILNSIGAKIIKEPSGKNIFKEICFETQLHFDVISNFDVKVLETFLHFVNKHLGIDAVKEMLGKKHKNGFNMFFFPTTAGTGNHLENFQALVKFSISVLGMDETNKILFEKTDKGSNIVFELIKAETESILKFLIEYFATGSGNLIDALFHDDDNQENVMHHIFRQTNSAILDMVFTFIEEFGKSKLNKLLLTTNLNKLNPLNEAITFKNSDSNIQKILKFIQDKVDSDTLIEIFSQSSVQGRRILHRATALQMNVATIESLLNILKSKTNSQQFHQILFLQDDFSQSFMHHLIQYQSESNIEHLMSFVQNQIECAPFNKCLYDSPVLFSAFFSNSESKLKSFLDCLREQFSRLFVREMLLFQNNQIWNILHYNVETSNSNLSLLIEYLKQKLNKNEIRELLLAKDVDDENPLCRAVRFTNNCLNIEIILKFIQDEVDSDTLIEIFSQPSVQGKRILHWAIAIQMNVTTIESLLNILKSKTNSQQFHQILFLQDDFSRTFMNHLLQYQPESNIKLLLPFVENQLESEIFQKCLYDKESQCSPALFSAFLSNSKSKLIKFLDFLQEQFGQQVLKEMLLFQNKQKWNILHYNVETSNSNLSFLIEHLKQKLNKNEIRELLLAKDVDDETPFCKAVRFTNNDSNIQEILKFIQDNVASDTLIEIFSQPSVQGKRILHWAP
jgi:hypothetical protein